MTQKQKISNGVNKETNYSPTLTQKTISASKWNGLFSFLNQAVGYLTSIVVARLLFPADFGLFAVAVSIVIFFQAIQSLGATVIFIQRAKLDEQEKYTIFWSNIASAIIIYLFIIFIAESIIPHFYQDSRLRWLLLMMGPYHIFNALVIIHQAQLMKDLQFKAQTWIIFLSQSLANAAKIVLALTGFGVYSLAVGFSSAPLFAIPFFYGAVRWLPKLYFNWHKFKKLIVDGLYITGANISDWGRNNADYLIAGKILGPVQLGYYAFAYRMVTLPITSLCSLFIQVFLPAFALVQNEKERLVRGYLAAIKYILIVIFPIVIGVFVLAKEFIVVIFTEKWMMAIPIIKILVIIGLIEVMQRMNCNLLQAKGLNKIIFWNQTFFTIVLVVALLFTVQYGIMAVAWTVMLTFLLFYSALQFITIRKLDINLQQFISPFIKPAIMAGLMGTVIFWQKTAFHYSDTVTLIAGILSGVIIYSLCMFVFDRKTILQGWRLLLNKSQEV